MRLRTDFLSYIILVFLIQSCSLRKDEVWVISAPAGESYTAIYQDSITVIPNGKLLTPLGRQIMVAPHLLGGNRSKSWRSNETIHSDRSYHETDDDMDFFTSMVMPIVSLLLSAFHFRSSHLSSRT